MEVASEDVFDAVRRGYSELTEASEQEILDYFSSIEEAAATGHINHIKGILFEQQYVEVLRDQGIEASLFATTNHPGTDISLFGPSEVVELQLKATDNSSYVEAAMLADPETTFVVTSEVAAQIESEMVIDAGMEDAVLESAVSETVFDEAVNPVGAFSILRWLVGFPF